MARGTSIIAAAAIAALTMPVAAQAADSGGPAPAASPFYSLLTISGATEYNPRGMTLTDHKPAMEGILEVGYKYRLYGAARVINMAMGDTTLEFDTAVGFRPVLSPFVLDFGVIHYDFNGSAVADFNEIYGAFVWPTVAGTGGQKWGVNLQGYWRPDNGDNYVQGDVLYVLHADPAGPNIVPRLVLSGRVAHQKMGALDYFTYGGALTYTFAPGLTGELRYLATTANGSCGGNLCDNRVMFKLSYATSMARMFGGPFQ